MKDKIKSKKQHSNKKHEPLKITLNKSRNLIAITQNPKYSMNRTLNVKYTFISKISGRNESEKHRSVIKELKSPLLIKNKGIKATILRLIDMKNQNCHNKKNMMEKTMTKASVLIKSDSNKKQLNDFLKKPYVTSMLQPSIFMTK